MKKVVILGGVIIISLILLGIIFVNQKSTNVERKWDLCIDNLSALNIFVTDKSDLNILSSNCSTCDPWYHPQVAEFIANVGKNSENYTFFFSSSCPRYQTDFRKYCISSKQKDKFYLETKQKICQSIEYFNSDIGTISCGPGVKDGVNDIDSFVNCLEEFHLMSGVNITEGKNLCIPNCSSNNNSCLISCFEDYVTKTRSEAFDSWCNQYEISETNKVVFSVEYPASSGEWQNIKIGADCSNY